MITMIAFQITTVCVIFEAIAVKLRVLNTKCVLCYVVKIERPTKFGDVVQSNHFEATKRHLMIF